MKDKRQASFQGVEGKYVLSGLSVALQGKVCLCVVRTTVEWAQDQLSFCGSEVSVML